MSTRTENVKRVIRRRFRESIESFSIILTLCSRILFSMQLYTSANVEGFTNLFMRSDSEKNVQDSQKRGLPVNTTKEKCKGKCGTWLDWSLSKDCSPRKILGCLICSTSTENIAPSAAKSNPLACYTLSFLCRGMGGREDSRFWCTWQLKNWVFRKNCLSAEVRRRIRDSKKNSRSIRDEELNCGKEQEVERELKTAFQAERAEGG